MACLYVMLVLTFVCDCVWSMGGHTCGGQICFFALANPRRSREGHVEGTGPHVSPLTGAPSLHRSGGGDGGPVCYNAIPPRYPTMLSLSSNPLPCLYARADSLTARPSRAHGGKPLTEGLSVFVRGTTALSVYCTQA